MRTSYEIANSFYASLNDQGSASWKTFCNLMNDTHPPTAKEIPATKPGWGVEKELYTECPFYDATSLTHFVTFSDSMTLFCHAFDSPIDLLKPEIVQATWLHLHIAILLACHQKMFTSKALLTMRVLPVIHGLQKQPQTVFPLAYAALKEHQDVMCELNDLPF